LGGWESGSGVALERRGRRGVSRVSGWEVA
jgi:hypothetical protein